MDPLKALHEWKKGERGETMMSTFKYKPSHDKMFMEGFREAEAYLEEEIAKLKALNEKMKRCDNCRSSYSRKDEESCSGCDISTYSNWECEE